MQETSKEVKLATGMDDMSDDEDMDLLKATDIDAYWLQVPPPAPCRPNAAHVRPRISRHPVRHCGEMCSE